MTVLNFFENCAPLSAVCCSLWMHGYAMSSGDRSRMNSTGDEELQERYLQVKHEKEKFKQRQEELEAA